VERRHASRRDCPSPHLRRCRPCSQRSGPVVDVLLIGEEREPFGVAEDGDVALQEDRAAAVGGAEIDDEIGTPAIDEMEPDERLERRRRSAERRCGGDEEGGEGEETAARGHADLREVVSYKVYALSRPRVYSKLESSKP
jgi:hypothetical protein